ncbi:SAM-dependent methyltransferase [Candidatus Roizmanbacteria bacterium]|nr:SAM-dependent methyltransferase [Candidatus Roizmanbacteria bacterium]
MPTLSAPTAQFDYELIDSGNEQKLERFGSYTLIRPEPKAIWKPELDSRQWQMAQGTYVKKPTGGYWKWKGTVPSSWLIRRTDLSFVLKPTSFKHVGIFPEQEPVWQWIQTKVQTAGRPVRMLNLFGYTGAATVAALKAGAQVTHVDASKESITWANENVKQNRLEGKPVRWIVDDVGKFVKRELNRGSKYDAILMDPPKFGRGVDGQVWKLEEDLPKLLSLCSSILESKPLFFFINAYAIQLSSFSLVNILSQTMKPSRGIVDGGELVLEPKNKTYPLSTTIFARWEGENVK